MTVVQEERPMLESNLRQRAVRLAIAASVVDGVGAAVGRREALVGEPFGLSLPVVVPLVVELALWGSATAAPLVMDLAACLLAPRTSTDARSGRAIVALGTLRLVGVACEPATWGRRRSRAATAMAPLHVGLAAAQIALGVTAGRRGL
jgi:hypothetical protein